MKILALISFAAAATAVAAVPTMADDHKKPPLSWPDMDTDGNRSVSLEEWTAGNRNPKNFAAGDANSDGGITRDEFRALVQRWKERQAKKES